MSEKSPIPVDQAFDPELRHDKHQPAQQDLDDYMASRPYKDERGNVHDPQTDKFINSDKYFDGRRDEIESEGQTTYEDMSMSDLAKKMGVAEYHGDKTMENDVHEVLHAKIMKQHEKTKSGVRDIVNNRNRMDNLVDRVASVKDREQERLKAQEQDWVMYDSNEAQEARKAAEAAGYDGIYASKTTETPTADDETPTAEIPTEGDDTPTSEIPTENMQVEDGAKSTEPGLPAGTEPEAVESGAEPEAPEAEPKQESRWERLKRGFWKHMYETPVDMTPMGPAIQPEIPFDEWYAQKRQGGEPGKVGRAFNKATDKIVDMAGNAAENAGNAATYVHYMGNIALINTAYYASEAYARTRDQLEEAKIRAKDYGIDAMLLVGNAGSIAAEKALGATERTDYMGQLMLDRMATLPPQVRDLLQKNRVESEEGEAERTHQADRLNVDIVSRKHNWD